MTNFPPGGDVAPDPPQDPGTSTDGTQGHEQAQAYGQAQGYEQPQAYGQAQGFEAPPGPGYAVAQPEQYPRGFHEFATGYLRWNTRITAYLLGLTDKYPPFRLSP